ncbi:SDR family oxidoreductase [Lentisalinibacter salinarum]|uniref:SDR family oxidoreductase n=1 Tax=Lentisalinibacter salinarum TaxID=2992239 RepID=UPI003866659C
MDIEGAAAIVTGGNRGIGEGFVRALLEAGAARVYVGARDTAAAQHLAEEFGDRAVPVALDVTDEAQVAAAAAECTDVSIVVNNAGVFAARLLIGADDMSGARQEMEVNYFGTLAMCRAFAPVLAANGGGAIVNVLSAAALTNIPNMGGYGPSKTATRFLSAGVRAEVADQGTQVTALIVGSVDTRMAAHVAGQKEQPIDIGRAGVKAIRKNIDEMDTDWMATSVRARIAMDPKGYERGLAKLLKADRLSTGK